VPDKRGYRTNGYYLHLSQAVRGAQDNPHLRLRSPLPWNRSYLDLPISQIHPNAAIAAEASRCALEKGKFWQMHDAMFADQSKLDGAALVKTAASLGLDQKSFESCIKSGKYKEVVQQDLQAGSQAGVNATPTFFINGEFLSGVRSDSDFTMIIDRQLSILVAKAQTEAVP